MDDKLQRKLKDFFLKFGARWSLNEATMEKVQRVINRFSLEKLEDVEEMCEYIVRHDVWKKPEEEMIEDLKNSKLFDGKA